MGGAALVGSVAVLLMLAPAAGGAALPGCGKFTAQADAQDAFLAAGGKPGRNLGRMDGDRDGVACEELPGPFKGYATIGFHRAKGFFYGVVTMPMPSGGAAACLLGDRHDPDVPRRLNVFRVHPDGDKPLLAYGAGTQALPEQGRLQWKIERRGPPLGRYYAAFEERVRLGPYGRNECPGFSSRPTAFPRPRT
jgi:hypothetical protein